MRYVTKRFLYLTIVLVCATLLTVSVTFQSSAMMIGLSTELLTKKSGLIITGEVKDIESRWADNKKAIVTTATIAIHEVVKGRSIPGTIKVKYEGGEVDGMGMRVSDAAELSGGESVLLFLKSGQQNSDGGAYEIVGKAQGKYTIDNDNIARKQGFSVLDRKEVIDDNIPVTILIEKIRAIENE